MRSKDRFLKATIQNLYSNAGYNFGGISIMTSGTVVVSVSAPGINSGDPIMAIPYMWTGALTTVTASAIAFTGVAVGSVRADAFNIFAVQSKAPAVDVPIAWMAVPKA